MRSLPQTALHLEQWIHTKGIKERRREYLGGGGVVTITAL